MGKKNRNEKPQNRRLDNRRKKEIKRLLSKRYLIEENKKVVRFLSLYIDCEATAKKYVKYYKRDMGQKSSSAYESLNYIEIKNAAKYFGIEIESDLVERIFRGSTGTRGIKTPRQLRNDIVHSKAYNDIEEVEQRFDELSKLMEIWLEKSRELIQGL